jgi:hypothetical protein
MGNPECWSLGISRLRSRAARWVRKAAFVVLVLYDPLARAQTPTVEEFNAQVQQGLIAEATSCHYLGTCGQSNATPALVPHIDPCYIKQNAMRPCTPGQQVSETASVDPRLVGSWELPLKGGPWVMEISSHGSYKFHSEAEDGVPSHEGKFSASNANWSLRATSGYTDAGFYVYQAPDIWIATGRLGVGAWRRPTAHKDTVRPCTPSHSVPKSSVDPELVGTWRLPLKDGAWVIKIGGDGTYKFNGISGHATLSNSGRFLASDGKWSVTGTNGYADSGLYKYQAPDIWIVAGKLGVAAWRRSASEIVACHNAQ